jgi:hypothetical protein
MNLINPIMCFRDYLTGRAGRMTAQKVPIPKIAIPSDLSVHLQALSVNVRNSCESLAPKSKGLWRVRLLRASTTTLKFQAYVSEPCGTLSDA